MFKNLRYLFSVLLLAVFSMSASATEVIFDFTGENQYGSGVSPSSANDFISINFANGDVSLGVTGARYWYNANGNTLRIYKAQNSTMTVAVPAGKVVTSIVIEANAACFSNVNSGTYSFESGVGTWTGSAQSVEFSTVPANAQIKTVTVTYGDATGVTVNAPTFNVESGTEVTKGSTVTISAGTGLKIIYTTDGTNPSLENGTLVESNSVDVTINDAVTIKAIAVDANNNTSSVATASYTVPFEITDGVFVFAESNYGSGIQYVTDGFESDPSTWTAGNVTMVVANRYRLWSNDKTLRVYKEGTIEEVNYDAATITFSVPAGNVITKIVSNPVLVNFTVNKGVIEEGVWTGSANEVVFTATGTTNFKTITVTYEAGEEDPVLTVDVTDAGYATLYSADYSVVVPEGVRAFTARIATSERQTKIIEEGVSYEEGDVIPAGEAVIIEAAAGQYDLFEGTAYTAPDPDNLLHGDVDATNMTCFAASTPAGQLTTDDYYYYGLANDVNINGVGFYWRAEGGAPFVNGENKAYLAVLKNDAAGVKAFFFGETTGIKAIENGQLTIDGAVYNLNGQRVNPTQRGIYIVNGKKVVVK